MFIPGTRIRLIRPPEGFEHLKGKCGKILRLLPIPQDPLVYCASIEQQQQQQQDSNNHRYDVDLNVSPGDVEVLIHKEEFLESLEEDEDDEEDLVQVNGLLFCKPHRLEVCGKCGMDFRHENLVKELGNFEGVEEAAEELDQALDAMNFPNRKAPGSNQYTPVVTPTMAVANILTDNLNPSALPEWPQGRDMVQEANRTFGSEEHKVEEGEKLPLRRVRETLVVIGHRVQYYLNKRHEQNHSALRILLQDKAQSEALCLDIVEPIREFMIVDTNPYCVPLFLVQWAHARASNQEHALQILSTAAPNTMMAEIPSRLDEMALLVELLKANAGKLDPAFIHRVAAPLPLAVSALVAIPFVLQTEYYNELGEYCHKCGTSTVKMLQCSQCKKTKYCSKDCQKKHWKYHKLTCQQPTDLVDVVPQKGIGNEWGVGGSTTVGR